MHRCLLALPFAFLVACSAASQADDASATALSSRSDLIGTWSVEKGGAEIPLIPFGSIASLILREDGSFDAAVAPPPDAENVKGTGVTGEWAGLRGTWSVAEGEGSASILSLKTDADVVAPQNDQPLGDRTFTVSFEDHSGSSALVVSTSTTKDTLLKQTADCRQATPVRSNDDTAAIDTMVDEVWGLRAGQDDWLLNYTPDLVLRDLSTTCALAVNEASREVVRDAASGALRGLQLTYSARDASGDSRTVHETYTYGATGALRSVIVETDRSTAAPDDTHPAYDMDQRRMYLTSSGAVSLETMQPRVDEARVITPGYPTYEGRRYDTVFPVDVVDMPACLVTGAASGWSALLPTSPKDANATLNAPFACHD